jgi:hypothetical protein
MSSLISHPTKRCDTCEHWVHGEQYGKDREIGWHADDKTGSCHRYAPRATIGDFEYEVLHALNRLVCHFLEVPEDSPDLPNWEECMLGISTWPATNARDWCGEWKQRVDELVGE